MRSVYLTLPLRSEYALIGRLAASGYCARVGLDIEKTEDVKVTISEILTKCISTDRDTIEEIKIEFNADDEFFVLSFHLINIINTINQDEENDLGLLLIEALCDKLEFIGNDLLVIKFRYKEHA